MFELPGYVYSKTESPDSEDAEYTMHDNNRNSTTYNHEGKKISK